jgi:hypothetical protein
VLNSVNLLGPPQASDAFPACTSARRENLKIRGILCTGTCHVTIGIYGCDTTVLEGIATKAFLTILGTRIVVTLGGTELNTLGIGQRAARECASKERTLSHRVAAYYELTADNSSVRNVRVTSSIGPIGQRRGRAYESLRH